MNPEPGEGREGGLLTGCPVRLWEKRTWERWLAQGRRVLHRRRFVRNVLLLAGGAALGQALGVAAAPILTRLYDPKDFGVYGVYMALVTMFSSVVCLRYEQAIPLPEDEDEARAVVMLAVAASVLCSLVSPLLFAAARLVSLRFGGDAIAEFGHPGYLVLFAVGLLATGVYQALNMWAVRRRSYRVVARTRVTQSLVRTASQVAFGFLKAAAGGLMIADAIARLGAAAELCRSAWKGFSGEKRQITLAYLWQVALRYRRFPQFSMTAGILNSAGTQLPQVLLVMFYGVKVGGLYALGQRVFALPMGLIGQSVGQVYVGEAASLARTNRQGLLRLYDRSALRLLTVALLPAVALAVLAPTVCGAVFGAKWVEAGTYLQMMAPAYVAFFVVSPLSLTLNILENQKLQLIWDCIRVVIVVLAIALPWKFGWSPSRAIGVYSASVVVAQSLLFLWSRRAIVRVLRK